MKRLRLPGLIACIGASALAPGAAVAQIAPNPTTFSVSGPVTFAQVSRPTLTCILNMTITVNPGGMTGAVVSATLSPGSPLCPAFATPANLPWAVNRIPPGTMGRFDISNVRIDGVGSQCNNGRLIVAWDDAGTGYLGTYNGTMPGFTPSVAYPDATCSITGAVSQISGPPITVY